jgi:lysozyme
LGSRKKNRFLAYRFWIAFFILLIAFVGYLYYIRHEVRFIFYPSFGIGIPTAYSVHGIDISRYQGQINWKQVSQMAVDSLHIWFVFIKATEGINVQDDRFRQNWKAARDAGLICGAYHFFYSTRDPLLQAKNFEKQVHLKSRDLPPVLDIEVSNDQPDSAIRSSALVWLNEIQIHYGVRPIIYTNVRFYTRHLGAAFDRYPLWISRFYLNQLPNTGRQWTFWQHSDAGHVNGISTPVDFNVFNGDSLSLMNLCVP